MEINTTSARIKYWYRQQMVEIDQHSEPKNYSCFFPFWPEKPEGNQHRKAKMEKIMNDWLKMIHDGTKMGTKQRI